MRVGQLPDGTIDEHGGVDDLSVVPLVDGPDHLFSLVQDQLLHPPHVARGALGPHLIEHDKLAIDLPQLAHGVDDTCKRRRKRVNCWHIWNGIRGPLWGEESTHQKFQ